MPQTTGTVVNYVTRAAKNTYLISRSGVGTGGSGGSMNRGPRAAGAPE